MADGDVHVTFRADEERWAVQIEGQTSARSLHETKVTAEASGRARAIENGSEIFVHGKDGQIQERNTYRRDPSLARG